MSTLTLDRDAQAVALLCSHLALPREGGPKPFGPAEWNRLAGVLRSTAFGRPGDLLGRAPSELTAELPIAPEQANRIYALLSRGGQLAIEVERLAGRGIWILTRADEHYPTRLKRRLRGDAPPLLYGAGDRSLLALGGVAVVGSRDADDDALAFARDIGRSCARNRTPVVSGAARGIDITAMLASLEGGGAAVGIAAEALERLIRRRELRDPLADGSLVLISPHHPAARFHAGNAMRRNRLIYCAADVAVVVASAIERGGTRAGALEALEARWVPVLVRDDGGPGNTDLLRRGAQPLGNPTAVSTVPHHGSAASLLDEPPALARSVSVADAEPAESVTSVPVAGFESTGSRTPRHSADWARERSDSRDIFAVIWPLLAAFLVSPRSETDIVEHFSLQRAQARAWLQRALDENLLRREGRTRRYVLADRQQTLESL